MLKPRQFLTALIAALIFTSASAAEPPASASTESTPQAKSSFVDRATATVNGVLDDALSLIGIRYRRGGQDPETGFDCSGFVGHVFRESMGLILPRSSKEISKTGESVKRNELQPGDLVFFNTMRHTFSHVGIYLGDNLFVHSPRTGGNVRVEDMREGYWAKRYNGARRVTPDEG